MKDNVDEAIATAMGKRLRALRLARGLTQSVLAAAMKSHRPCVGRVENGRSGTLSVETIKRYCAALDVPPDVIYSMIEHFRPVFIAQQRRREAQPENDSSHDTDRHRGSKSLGDVD